MASTQGFDKWLVSYVIPFLFFLSATNRRSIFPLQSPFDYFSIPSSFSIWLSPPFPFSAPKLRLSCTVALLFHSFFSFAPNLLSHFFIFYMNQPQKPKPGNAGRDQRLCLLVVTFYPTCELSFSRSWHSNYLHIPKQSEGSVVQSIIPKAAACHTQTLKERRRGSEVKGGGPVAVENYAQPCTKMAKQRANHT